MRWWQHASCARRDKHNQYLYSSMRKHGADKFTMEIVDTAETAERLNQLEFEWIAKLQTTDRKFGYNCTFGGDHAKAGPSAKSRQKGWRVVSAETRARISAAHKGKKLSPERIEKMRARLLGRKQGAEEIARRSNTNREVWKDPERVALQSERCKGRLAKSGRNLNDYHTPETIAQASEGRKRWRETPEGVAFRKRMSDIQSSRNRSPEEYRKIVESRRSNPEKFAESRKKLSAARKLWWSLPENRARVQATWEKKMSLLEVSLG